MASHVLCVLALSGIISMVSSSPTYPSSQHFSLNSIVRGISRTCPLSKYRCPSSGRCISGDRHCDGHPDCPEGEDESTNECKCRSDQFQCLNGTCISGDNRCNGYYNCLYGEDELHCRCAKKKFQCVMDGYCIPSHWKCDGVPNCQDESDETNCPMLQRSDDRSKYSQIANLMVALGDLLKEKPELQAED